MESRRLLAGMGGPDAFVPIRINAGGGAVVDSLARPFVADVGFVGGAITTTSEFIGTAADYRAGAEFSFSHPLASGTYTVIIKVADPTSTLPGQRVFDVFAEGNLAINDFDASNHYKPNPSIGDNFHSIDAALAVKVKDGTLRLRFVGVVGEALVSAISIYSNESPEDVLPFEQTARTVNGLPHEDAVNVRDSARLRNIGTAGYFFASDFRGRFPWSWQEMAGYTDGAASELSSAWRVNQTPRGLADSGEAHAFAESRNDFVLLMRGVTNRTLRAESILGYRNLNLPGAEIPVLFGDGHVELIGRDALRAALSLPPTMIDKDLGDLSTRRAEETNLLIKSRLNAINIAINTYRNSHSNQYPPSLGELYQPNNNAQPSIFINPRFPVALPTGLTRDEMVIWINQNAGFRYNRLTGSHRYRFGIVHVYEDPQRVAGPVWISTNDFSVRLYEPMWADELLRNTAAQLGTMAETSLDKQIDEPPMDAETILIRRDATTDGEDASILLERAAMKKARRKSVVLWE